MPIGVYPRTPEQYASRSGEKHWAWKGGDVGYVALHDWIVKVGGRADHCEKCGATEIPEGKQYWFEWSCKGVYDRNLQNWWQLCIPCHRKYDHWYEKITSPHHL